MNACHVCLRRMWLIEQLAGRIETQRTMVDALLGRSDLELITLLGGSEEEQLMERYACFRHADSRAWLADAAAGGLSLVCLHADEYPDRLRGLSELAPAVLSVNGTLDRLVQVCSQDTVAVVGTRQATTYGSTAAHRMAKDLAAAGMTVVSGMAYGIDSAAHEGALAAGGQTLAVLAGAADRAYPVRKTWLFRKIVETGVVISERARGTSTRRWALQARDRLIAGLSLATIVIEAPKHSGALITVRHADRFGRLVGVLPGPVGVSQSAGTNLLLAKHRAGRHLFDPARVRAVRNAQDVLDMIYGEGTVEVRKELRQVPTASEAALLAKISAGLDNVTMIDATMLAELTALELKGWLVRGAGGALTVVGN